MKTRDATTVAMLLSCDSFESFFGAVLHLDRDEYLRDYRNDWSWYYATGLIENGIRPIIYIPSLKYEGLYETEVGVSVRFLRLARWYRPFAPFCRAMRATRWSVYLQERANATAFVKPLNEAIAIDGVDFLYVQDYWNGRFDHLAHRVPVPIAAADHGGIAKGVVKWFKRSAFRQAARIYCQTLDEYSQVRRYGERAALQPNGVDTSFFFAPSTGTQRGKNVVTVSRLTDKQKRTSDLIRAMALLPMEWTLDIIGTGPDREALESLANSLGVKTRVTFRGFKPRSEIRAALQTCGVYAMPSSNEGMCMAVLEAMSCGAPIVASRIRAFEAVITENVNGKLFPMGDVPALARGIQMAWIERDSLGPAAAASISQNYDAKLLFRKFAQDVRHIVRSHPSIRSSELHSTVGA